MLARRLLMGGGGGSFTLPLAGPYLSDAAHDVTVLAQFHCHTTSSDGFKTPAEVVAGYLGKGYGALMLTDHDMVTSQPAGITTAIPGNETSPAGQHIISINSTYTRGAVTDAQAILDGIAAAGGYAEIAHPRHTLGMTYAEMAALTNYLGIEIHNAVTVIDSAGVGSGDAVALWDELLTNHRRDLWGFAVDDFHQAYTTEIWDIGRVHIFAASNTLSALMAAVAEGRFVADVSNYGVTPGYPVRDSTHVTLTCTGATRIEARGELGVLLQSTAGDSIDYSFAGTEGYVRLVAVGDYTEPFSAALSDRWLVLGGTWAVGSGVLSMTNDASSRRIMLRNQRAGDFAAQVDVKLDASTAFGSLMFNVRMDGDTHYVVQFGGNPTASRHNKLCVGKTETDDQSGAPLGSTAFTHANDTWYTLKMDYVAATGTVRCKVWETGTGEPDWMLTVVDTSWDNGAFGFRGLGAPQFDNLYINGFRSYYQPIPI